ncbi:Hypothetical predicted protein [Paramuricea clavata]|uniref:Uncharacterized protein n=1 Tax=Paramuricea clavata TaxID=317549 RepID=A0A6S7ID46_PARCT|nr:Hypothetical predicted protein [Paramuricea clavata]
MLRVFVFLILLNKSRTDAFLEPVALSNVLAELKDEVLGVKRMQTFFDNSKFVYEKVDGKREIDLLSNLLRQRFHDNIFALEQIKTTVENAYSNQQVYSSPIYPECCNINPTETDYRFKTKVFRDRFCELRAKYVSKGAKHLSKSLKETMINNLNKNPDLKWQYFGSQEGILPVYPAFKFPSCDSYDNRVRPWYVEGIAPEPKDIVLIIDKSGSMEDIIGNKTLIEIAVSSAVSVLNSLNSNDRAPTTNEVMPPEVLTPRRVQTRSTDLHQ